MEFFEDQKTALIFEGHLALTASPGSGKTTIISQKIRNGIHDQSSYYGAVAVSYTNRASNNLREKCSSGGVKITNCYFGTIDKFCISEILIPFVNKVLNCSDLYVLSYQDLVLEEINGLVLHPNEPYENHNNNSSISKMLEAGFILLELAAEMALFILKRSLACKRYITSKYTHIFIDEYQDCNVGQHALFLKMKDLGLTCIAAGDTQQSIFKYAKKDPRYLIELTEHHDFEHIEINKNYRSHLSIEEYSKNFRSQIAQPSFQQNESKVIQLHVNGDEQTIQQAINDEINSGRIDLQAYTIGVFYTSNQKCERANLAINNSTFYPRTPLDENSSLQCNIFKDILINIQDPTTNSFEFASRFFHPDLDKLHFQNTRRLFSILVNNFKKHDSKDTKKRIVTLAKIVTGDLIPNQAIKILEETLNTPSYISSYAPIREGVLNIMTYHKAKGLEFDIVFMPDLYQYILPNMYRDINQEENVFFVGITRAKKKLFLISSSKRHNAHGVLMDAQQSMFLEQNEGQRFCQTHHQYVTNKITLT